MLVLLEYLGFMIITFFGDHFVKLQVGQTTVAVNPPSQSYNKKAPRFGANVILASNVTDRFCGVDTASYGDADPFVANGPGDFESSELHIHGELTHEFEPGNDTPLNTMYSFVMDGMNILVLGDIKNKVDMRVEAKELFENVDVVIVPVKMQESGPEKTAAFVRGIGAKLVIPVGYTKVKSDDVKEFVDTLDGIFENSEKLTIKSKDLSDSKMEVRVLSVV